MLNKLNFLYKNKTKTGLKTSKSVIDTLHIPNKEKNIVDKNISSLILQSITNFFRETGRIAEVSKSQKMKKYSRIASNDAIALFPFLGNESNTGYNKVVVFSAYCDLLEYLVNTNKDKAIISSVLENIKIIYFQNNTEIKPLLNYCTPIIELGLQCINSADSCESANTFLSSFTDTFVKTNATEHIRYFNHMLTKKPFYKSRKFLTFGLAGLGLMGYFIHLGEDTNHTSYTSPIIQDIQYPRNDQNIDDIHNVGNKKQPNKKNKEPNKDNSILYTHQATGISILPVLDEKEYDIVSDEIGESGTYHAHNDYKNISTTVDNPNLKIDREITKNQFYKIITLLRNNKKYSIDDITYGFSDEIRIEDLPGNVAGLFKSWSDNPTDKDIYLDTDLVHGGTQIEQEGVLLHEFIHSLIGTSSSTLRNEGMTESLTHRSFYDSRKIDLFDFDAPYGPHVLDFIMIHNTYGNGYNEFKHFGLELVYNYQDLSTPVVNSEYASGLAYILSNNPKSVISPVVIAFFTGGLEGIVQAKNHFLCTPGTKHGFDVIKSMYKKSILYDIEKDNNLTTREKVEKAIAYFEANKGTLSDDSPSDELPGNIVNVNSDTGKAGQRASRGGKEQENIGQKDDNQKEKKKISGHEYRDISRQEFLRDLALTIAIYGDDGRLGIYLDGESYPWYEGKIDPQYFSQQIKNIIKDRIEREVTRNVKGRYTLTAEENAIIEDVFKKNFQKVIASLAQAFESEIKSDQTYKYWTEGDIDFMLSDDPRGLQKTSERVVDEYLKNIDINSLILNQDNIYDIIKIIAEQLQKGGNNLISESLLQEWIRKDLTTYCNENNITNKVPLFEESYMSIDGATLYLSLEYTELIKSSEDITYTFEENQGTISMIERNIKEKNIGILDAISFMLHEQNQQKIATTIKQGRFYQEAIHRYTDPLGKDQNYFLKKIYDTLNFVDNNKNTFFWMTNILLLVIIIFYFKNRQGNKNNTKHALGQKYKLQTNNVSDTFPIDGYINRQEMKHIPSTSKKLFILNLLLFLSFLVGSNTSDMKGYQRNVLHASVEEYKKNNPKWKRTPHTYKNLLFMQKSGLKPGEIEQQVANSYQTDNDPDSDIKSYYWAFPYQPPLRGDGYETTIPTTMTKQVAAIYKPLAGSAGPISAKMITATHKQIENKIGKSFHINTKNDLSKKGLRGSILLTIGSLTSLLLLGYNASIHLKKIKVFRNRINQLISGRSLFSINEKDIDLIMNHDLSLWDEIQSLFGNMSTIQNPTDIQHLVSSINLPGEKLDQFPFTCQAKKLSTFDRETLGRIADTYLSKKGYDLTSYDKLKINYQREMLLGGKISSEIGELYKNNSDDIYHTVLLNYIEHYLPRIIVAKTKGRSVETYINHLPYPEQVVYFSNVRLLKNLLGSDETDLDINTNGFNIHCLMTPQVHGDSIKQPTSSSSAIIIGW